ncbi:MAG: carboxylating nicotinate-nucleotide diphosphorylase [Bacteroidales bacterium]|nr:carboxylating nicotinate-nucleotide diphosphorylase [Bacteroidales bacterium]
MEDKLFREFILRCIEEDTGDGDHSSLACIPADSEGKAKLLIKEEGILAGIRVAVELFKIIDAGLCCEILKQDGDKVSSGDTGFILHGNLQSILRSERLMLNIMQRMSGIATNTGRYVTRIAGTRARILDTRKTTPGMRMLEKEAVRIGGGMNHRMGLYDMIMLKDNHIAYAGSIEKAIDKTREYLEQNGRDLKIVIEARNTVELERILKHGGVQRIMLDNFSIADTRVAVDMIDGRYETESSGKINLETVRPYAECGVDFISVGAITHQINSLDISLMAF